MKKLSNILLVLGNLCYTWLMKIKKKGDKTIKKLQYRNKIWLDNRNRKFQLKIYLKNKRRKLVSQKKSSYYYTYNHNTYIAHAPNNFSIIYNPDETIKFFNYILIDMKRKKFNRNYFFDLTDVTNITTDTLMYILAILRNLKSNKIYRYSYSGNLPIDQNSKQKIIDSGFYCYVRSISEHFEASNEKFSIITGKIADPKVARTVCDIVNRKFGTALIFTAPLYKTLIELMTNTVQHAYDKVSYINSWYIFVEQGNNRIRFTFLDTGLGIPSTVAKKYFLEPIIMTDSQYILSALKGEIRSETKQPNRGNGLPLIKEFCENKKLENLRVYSGHGNCSLNGGTNPILSDFKNEIFGTLFYWELSKGEL